MRMSRHKGIAFTLVEVLIVVAIMGLAAAIVVPQMLNPGKLHIQAAVRSVIADLMVAQNEAVVRHAPRCVVFDIANSQYTLTEGDGTPLSAPWGRDGVHRVSFRKDNRFKNVRLENANFGSNAEEKHIVEFDEMGAPAAGGSIDVVSGTTRYRIKVSDMTGKVTVESVAASGG